jgi:EmrB/QacA subfamily drug resistance transporter
VDRRTLTLIAAILGSSLAFLDAFIVQIALPTMRDKLHFGFVGAQWVVLSYSLALVALYLIAGAVGDRFGRRRVFLTAIAWFAIASAVAGFAPNVGVLVGARVAQGIAAAFVSTNSLAMIRVLYKEQAGQAIGTWTAATSAALIVGPSIGGLIVLWSWRLIFFINLPLSIVAVVCILLGAKEEESPGARRRFDLVGAGLGAAAFLLLTLGLTRAQKHSFASVWWLLALAAVAFVAFIVLELRLEEPLLPLGLFKERVFAAANLETFLVYGALQSAGFYIAQYLQSDGIGLSSLWASFFFIPPSILLTVLSRRVGRFADQHGPRLPLAVGPLLLAAGYGLFATVGNRHELWIYGIPGAALFSVGLVLIVAPITAAALSAAPDRFAGVASGVNTTLSRLGGLTSIAVVGLVIAGVAGNDVSLFKKGHESGHELTASRHGFEAGMGFAAGLALAGAAVGAAGISRRKTAA